VSYAFARPGFVRIATSFELEAIGDGTRLSTETRVQPTILLRQSRKPEGMGDSFAGRRRPAPIEAARGKCASPGRVRPIDVLGIEGPDDEVEQCAGDPPYFSSSHGDA